MPYERGFKLTKKGKKLLNPPSRTCPRCGATIPDSQITAVERPNGEWVFFGRCDCSEDAQSLEGKES